MNPFKLLTVSWLFLILFALVSCSGSKDAGTADANQFSKKEIKAANEVEPKVASLSLADYLRRIAGVRVIGRGNNVSVMVRTADSVTQSGEPLFVINGTQVGNSYAQAASMVEVNDIKSVRVLKDLASTSSFGLRGSFGVIVIKTKGGH